MKDFKTFFWFSSLIIAVVIILCAGKATVQATTQKVSDVAAASQNVPKENSLLQFSAGGHILGFKPDRVYFASFDHAIVEEFVGAKGVMPVGEAGKAGKENQEGKKGAPALGKVVYKNLWQGVTLQYEARDSGIAESAYTLEPEADVKNIKLKYNVSVGIEKDGSLRFRHPSENGYFSQSAPKAWQEIESKRSYVEVAFADYGDNTFGFRLGEYDRKYPVVIDPTYQWHTFYGTLAGPDYGRSIAVDTGGNVYITGDSDATWNGPGALPPLNAFSGGDDIVVLKLNNSGTYQWHSFYGSADFEYGYSIAVDTGGNVYITGQSDATWNGPGAAAPLNAHSGSQYRQNIVVLKLNTNGAYQWHTFYGSGNSGDTGRSIAVDTGGNVYIAGDSKVTWNGPGAAAPLNAFSGNYDMVVLKLDTNGAYLWHTFYGNAAGIDYGNGIAVDTGGNVYITGRNYAWNGPGGAAPLNAFSGNSGIVVLKLDTNGAYLWHTFYGNPLGLDYGKGIAVDTGGNVYITGYSYGTWNGPGGAAPLNAFSGYADIVVLKLNTSGAYQWHAFYGAAGDYSAASTDFGKGIAVDTGGNLYITGYSEGTWGAPLNAHGGSGYYDIVVLKLNTSGAYQWHTFYGSNGSDGGDSIAVDTGGNVYITGYSTATWGAPLNAFSGNTDIVVLKLYDYSSTLTLSTTSLTFTSTAGTSSITVTGSGSWTATSSLSWVTITSGSSGTGNGTVVISVTANTTGATRTGNITIAGQTVVITQSAASGSAVSLVTTTSQTSYDTIQAAYDANTAATGSLILVQGTTLTETLVFNRNNTITLTGGYDSSFTNVGSTMTIVSGLLTISSGSVTVANIVIQ